MMNYIGKICPYCKTEFAEGDDIVVCSVCEMPHHKECWIENKACTTFGCTGTISGVDLNSESDSIDRFCANCGAKLKPNQKFCTSCGSAVGNSGEPRYRVAGDYSSPPATQNYINANQQYTYQPSIQTQQQYTNNNPHQQGYNQPNVNQDLFVFLQSSQSYYIARFLKIQQENNKVSWNWASFWFSAYWMAYRKMYGYAAAYLAVCLILAMIPSIGFVLILIMSACSGIFGNYLYKQYVDKELRTAQMMDPINKNAHISKKGGTNIPAVIITIVAYIIVAGIIQSM